MAEYATLDETSTPATDTVPGGSPVAAPAGKPAQRFSVRRMARLLGVSTSSYYAHLKRGAATVLTPRQQLRADRAVKILDVHAESRGTYGSPLITAELRERGEVVNEKSVAAIIEGGGHLIGHVARNGEVRGAVDVNLCG